MDTNQINIGYGGFLQFFDGDRADVKQNWFSSKFINYRIDNIDHQVRSAFYLFKAISEFKRQHPSLAVKLHLHLWGKIEDGNAQLAHDMGISELVEISGPLSKIENLKKLESMDVLFLPMEIGKGDSKSLFIPGKVYEYLLLKKPILGIGGDSDARNLLLESRAAKVFEPDATDRIVDYLKYATEDKNNLNFAPNQQLIESKSYDHLADQLVNVFNQC